MNSCNVVKYWTTDCPVNCKQPSASTGCLATLHSGKLSEMGNV